jgi:HlyD family secretion protein
VGQAEAERERMSAALARARSNLRRVRSLSEAGAAAEDDAESAETAVRTSEEALRAAEFNVARAKHDLEMANARLAPSAAGARTVDVVAPVSGVILKRLRESETVVPVGDPIVEIGNPESLQIVTDLLSTDAVRVSPGDAVIIDAWGGGAPLDGRVQRVEPSGFTKVSALGVEEQRVNVIIDLVDAAAAKRLGDGYRVEVRVVLWREASTLRVPVGTLFRHGDSWAVFTVDDDRARTQAVELGQRNDTHGQILGGLSEGQRIVLHPPDTLTDGTHVTIRAGSAP